MASLTSSELSQLPTDVLVSFVIPMLSRQETPLQELNRWARDWAHWYAHHRTKRCPELPSFRPMGESYQHCHVSQPGIGLSSFIIWGAAQDIPLSVYLQLETDAEQLNKQHLWVCLMCYRQVQKGQMEWEAQPRADERDGFEEQADDDPDRGSSSSRAQHRSQQD